MNTKLQENREVNISTEVMNKIVEDDQFLPYAFLLLNIKFRCLWGGGGWDYLMI